MSGTVAKAFNLLELLSKYDGPVRMADLARAASMNKSTAYRLLETLSQLGYVTQDEPNGRYLLTTKMWEIGVRAFQRSDLRIAAKPYLEELVAKTGEMAVLSRRDGRDVIVVEKVDCSHPLQAITLLGSRSPIHASSIGKAFLMTDPPEKLAELAPHLVRFTDRTITDIDTLIAHVAEARSAGTAIGRDEYREGVSGVAAPVIGTDGVTYATIGISVPSYRLTDDLLPKYRQIVADVARRFSRQIGHDKAA